MERPIGNIFEYKGKSLRVVDNPHFSCESCIFGIGSISCEISFDVRGRCSGRNDGKYVIFKRKENESFKFLK